MASMTASAGATPAAAAPATDDGDARLAQDVAPAPPPPPKRQIDRGPAQKAEPDAHPVDKSLPVDANGQPQNATAAATETPPPGTLLVYTAHVTMAVYQVDSAIDAVESIARGVGGYLAARNDTEVRVRVPRARFDEALHKVEASGDVIHRDIAAEDVTDAYVDTEARLKNARAVRDRLQALLEKASVKEAIDIQRELERVTGEIEVLEGKLASLENRVAYSTIDVAFQARGSVALHESPVKLPFPWLGELGLPRLLDLQGAQ
jgi:hypothetical protein